MTRRGDATSALLRAVLGSFEGFRAEVEEIRSRSWASATFSGTRHEVRVRIVGAGADAVVDRFIAGLADVIRAARPYPGRYRIGVGRAARRRDHHQP